MLGHRKLCTSSRLGLGPRKEPLSAYMPKTNVWRAKPPTIWAASIRTHICLLARLSSIFGMICHRATCVKELQGTTNVGTHPWSSWAYWQAKEQTSKGANAVIRTAEHDTWSKIVTSSKTCVRFLQARLSSSVEFFFAKGACRAPQTRLSFWASKCPLLPALTQVHCDQAESTWTKNVFLFDRVTNLTQCQQSFTNPVASSRRFCLEFKCFYPPSHITAF